MKISQWEPSCSVRTDRYIEFSLQIFENIIKYKISRKSLSGSRVVPCGQTDRHDEANSRFSEFCESA